MGIFQKWSNLSISLVYFSGFIHALKINYTFLFQATFSLTLQKLTWKTPGIRGGSTHSYKINYTSLLPATFSLKTLQKFNWKTRGTY
jgi:hypothetical protein